MIAAGANHKAVQTLMGHTSIEETYDRYGHLFPGGVEEVGALLDKNLGVPDARDIDPAPVSISVST